MIFKKLKVYMHPSRKINIPIVINIVLEDRRNVALYMKWHNKNGNVVPATNAMYDYTLSILGGPIIVVTVATYIVSSMKHRNSLLPDHLPYREQADSVRVSANRLMLRRDDP